MAVVLDLVIPLAYFIFAVLTAGWFLLITEIVLFIIGAVLWVALFRELGLFALIPAIATIIGIVLLFTIIGILLGLIIFVLPWFIIAVVWHWWSYKR